MGINVRVSDVTTERAAKVTRDREMRERNVRDRVRRGEMTLDAYSTQVRGFKPEHLAAVRDGFRTAIFGAARKA